MKLDQLIVGQGLFRLGPLSWQLPATGLVQLRGPNGSGKTTLLKTLLRRLRPISGKIFENPSLSVSVGVESLFFETWTVNENWRWFHSLIRKEVPALPPLCQSLAHLKFGKLSQGQKRSLELAFALNSQAPLLLLDEPLSPLDAKNRIFFSEQIARYSQSGLCLLTGHDELHQSLSITQTFELSL